VFVGERDCQVEEIEVDDSALGPAEVLIEVEVSVVSAGTEVANYTGLDPGTRVPGSWNAYPHRPGYGAVGRVAGLPRGSQGPEGPAVPGAFKVGERVFAVCRHARYAVADTSRRPLVSLGPDDDPHTMVLARMASVAITAVRKASAVDLGATAVVVGLGLVGNFAAQLLQLSGMNVLGVDLAAHRVAMAREVGLNAIVVTAGSEREAVQGEIGRRADVVVEATGAPDASPIAVGLCRDGGDVVLLGSPRGPFRGDATKLLSEVHHRGLRLVGALEWTIPLHSGPWQSRWSLNEDFVALFDLLRRGKLRTEGLVTDVVGPWQAQDIYSRLAAGEPGLGAVLFDWG
jgi:2-desacetyl-2-hydroxyethyl bacteriochlorophyllide A dehydrogenase